MSTAFISGVACTSTTVPTLPTVSVALTVAVRSACTVMEGIFWLSKPS